MKGRVEPDGGIESDFYSFRLVGIFHSDNANYGSTRIVATMPAVQRMVGAGDVVSRIDVKTNDSEHADRILAPLKAKLAGKATLQTWREMNKALFDALAVEHDGMRSEEHTSELQSLMRISYAGFCLKKKKTK